MAHELIQESAQRPDVRNRLDVLVVRLLDEYFRENFPAAVPVWLSNREMIARYLFSQIGPLQVNAQVEGPAKAVSDALHELISNRGDFLIRIAWGRYRPLIEAFLGKEFSKRGGFHVG